nr:gustatory receptor 39 [Papilio xuthus]
MKVTPYKVSPKEINIVNKFKSMDRLKYLINIEMFVGINRIYLLDCSKTKFWLTQLSTPIILIITIYQMMYVNVSRVTYLVSKNTFFVELLFLCINGSYFRKGYLKNCIIKLKEFDMKLNLKHQLILPRTRTIIILAVAIFITIIIEYIFMNLKNTNIDSYYSTNVIYLGILIHKFEMLFYCTLLYSVFLRIRILKQHVEKKFAIKEQQRILHRGYKIENINDKINLDVKNMHLAYELLHSSSEDLNTSLSFPMTVMLISSGIVNTMLFKFGFNTFDIGEGSKAEAMFCHVLSGFTILQCIKTALLVVIPCYLSSRTAEQITDIRRILNDAILRNEEVSDKLERRKIKAFYQLARDNDFSYVLWGLIRLDMSLPMSYSGLCVTYLIIVLQFDKFFD